MSLTECEYCGKKVGNLAQHFQECSKAQKAFSKEKPKIVKRTTPSVAPPKSKIEYLKRGPKTSVTSCSLCDNEHYAHGLCKRCYMRQYMRDKRNGNGEDTKELH